MPNSKATPLRIATIQMVSSDNFENNLQTVKRLITHAAEQGAKMVVLPEYFAIMALKETDKFAFVEPHGKGVLQEFLSATSKQYQVWIIAGSHPIASDEENRPFGRCYVYNDLGELVTWYDKIHLFDVEVADNQRQYCESRYTKPGDRAVSFETPWGRVGLAICYDLRFPELFREMQTQGCVLFLVPAAFTEKTGKAHWDILTRARALENLSYLVSSAQGGVHANGRHTWGHSNIISPWGEVLNQLDYGEGVVIADLDFCTLQAIRKEFPALTHKRI